MNNRNLCNVVVFGFLLAFTSGVHAQAMYVTPSGDVGIGTDSPVAPLEIRRTDGTGQVLVDNNGGGITARQLFRGKNNGPALFALKDTTTSRTWAFTVIPEGFTMSRQGSGVKEFFIANNGDATLEGTLTELSDRDSKQDIEPVNGQHVLAKIAQLEISEWSYKDSPQNRHIGPMSQDFFKAFKLGGKNGVKGISTLDSSGVSLAAIKALIEENTSLKERLRLLESQQAETQAIIAGVIANQQEQRILASSILN